MPLYKLVIKIGEDGAGSSGSVKLNKQCARFGNIELNKQKMNNAPEGSNQVFLGR